jgi:transcriptional regulator GlxA family with amidase domain
LTVHDRSRDAGSIEIRVQKLDRALSWIHRNIAAHLDVVALARLSNMKAPAMCHHFMASFGMPPMPNGSDALIE